MPDVKSTRTALPRDPAPLTYHLHIHPNFGDLTFCGQVTIRLQAAGAISSFALNCAALKLSNVAFRVEAGSCFDSVPFTLDETNETVTITLPDSFTGFADLTVTYSGPIRDDLLGFYRSKYTELHSGDTKYIFATQFCPVEARKTFPCWDEPGRKARFALWFYAPEDMCVLFNVPHSRRRRSTGALAGELQGDSLVCWEFPLTPPMSTYLLAWAVGHFDYMERIVKKVHHGGLSDQDPAAALVHQLEDSQLYSNEETVLRVVTSPGRAESGLFALEVAVKALAWYEEMLGCNYPLPKLDLVAIPELVFGGMENFGLIALLEAGVLVDSVPTSNRAASIATIVAHEVSHMWLGDVVSMQWWNELWLNESVATWVTNVALSAMYPEWDLEVLFAHEEGSRAFTLDALRSSHPVEMVISSAQQLDSVFDAISYAKGGCVLRMVTGFVGRDTFFAGIRTYLTRHRYSNATTEDLWNALGEAAGFDLTAMMKNWTGCQGFPFVTVSAAPGNEQAVLLTQHRFLASKNVKSEDDCVLWQLPLTSEFGPDRVLSFVLSDMCATLSCNADGAADDPPPYVKVNKDRLAFCRVMYSDALLHKLLANLSSCSNLDRFALVSDYAAFARGGYCSSEIALAVLSSLQVEEDYTVLCESFAFVDALRALLAPRGLAAMQVLNRYVERLYAHVAQKLGYEYCAHDSFLDRRLRVKLFTQMIAARNDNALAAARKFYEAEMENHVVGFVTVPGDQRAAVYMVFARDHGETALSELLRRAAITTDSIDRANYLTGLAGTQVENAVPRIFDYALSDKVDVQDVMHIFSPLAFSPEHGAAFVRELLARWPAVAAKVPGLVQTRIVGLTQYAADASLLPRLHTFHDALDVRDRASIGTSLQQAIESVELNAAWAERDGDSILRYINSAFP